MSNQAQVRLAAAGLAVGYGDALVLRGVSVDLAAGSLTGIIGPNGAGKSTLLRGLSGFLPPRAGTVRLDGADLGGLPAAARARRIAFVPPQLDLLFPLAVEELVAAGRTPHASGWRALGEADRRAVDEALRAADLLDRRHDLLAELSAGQQQRALLATALAQQTDVLLLDEPTAHLDIQHAWDLFERLRGLAAAQGLCVAVATHDLHLAAAFCETVILLDQGAVAAAGPAETVLVEARLAAVYRHPIRVIRHEAGTAFCPVRTPPRGARTD
jgi:ABC-type cobalamin/Fe3+-siderophores transport system ATPase subunit